MPDQKTRVPGAQPTHCATCPINVGCSWGCLRADDFAEIAQLRDLLQIVMADPGFCRLRVSTTAQVKAHV